MRLRNSRKRYPITAHTRDGMTDREGVTLLEVVFSIGVATIGLLAAVALIPVAARQVELGLIADQAAATGEAAQQTADIIGLRNPLQWRTFFYTGVHAPLGYGRNPGIVDINIDYGFRQAAYDANVLLTQSPNPPFTRLDRPPYSPPITSFCIDPFLLSDMDLLLPANAGAMCDNLTANQDVRDQHMGANYDLQLFPYFTKHPFDDGAGTPVTPIYNMRRLTLGAVAGAFAPTTSSMSAAQAERLFTMPDDVVFKRSPTDRTFPAIQEGLTVDDASLRYTMKRQTNQDLSWMATFVPLLTNSNASTYSSTMAVNSLGNTRPIAINNEIGTNATYTMSIVVHRRRTPPRFNVVPGASPAAARYNGAGLGLNRNGLSGQASDEMVAEIAGPAAGPARGFLSGGFAGGEVVIETPAANQTPLNHIRANDWVLLSGITSAAAANFGQTGLSRDVGANNIPPPVIRHQWYRVVNVGELVEAGSFGGIVGRHARAVTLEGPDWQVGNFAVQVTIVPSVVAVFEKTVTLAYPLQ